MMRLRSAKLAGCLLFAFTAPWGSVAQAQEAAVLKRSTALREAPSDSAAALATLEAQAAVLRSTERKGPWVKVSTSQGSSGWVHLFDLSAPSSAPSPSGNVAAAGLRGLGALLGGTGGTTTTATSTVGIRGLSAEDLAKAQPQPARVAQAEELRASAEQARRFASGASLQPRQIAPLPEPPRPQSPSSAGAPGSSSNPSDPDFSPH